MIKKKTSKRPQEVNMILGYNILLIIYVMFSRAVGGGGIVGILYLIAMYYGLYKMRRVWTDAFIFLVAVSTLLSLGMMYSAGIYDILSIIIVVVNTVSIVWLFNNRNLFTPPVKKKKK